MNDAPGCPGTAAKLPYIPGNQKLTPPSSAHELFVDNKTEITNRNALSKRRTPDRMRLIVVKTCDLQLPHSIISPFLLFTISPGIAGRVRCAIAKSARRLVLSRYNRRKRTHSSAGCRA